MKNFLLLTSFFVFTLFPVKGQVFGIDTLKYSGDVNKRINFVLLGDGYTAAAQNDYIIAATDFINYLFSIAPFSNYASYFNVFAIKVLSNELGASHPNTAFDCSSASPIVPTQDVDTYFKCSFDVSGVHRCIYVNDQTSVYDVMANFFPNYDQIVVLSNTPYYGGCGGGFAVSTVNAAAKEIVAHELGHSFGHLEDEYAKPSGSEAPNLTQNNDATSIKWKNWLGSNGVGIYQVDTSTWYRPHQNCKMQYLNKPYCSVCQEALIERIHTMVSSIDDYSPGNLNVANPDTLLKFKLITIHPNPNTLKIVWKMDGNTIANNTDSIQINQPMLASGNHTLIATVVDSTTLVRVDNHSSIHYNQVIWNITKTNLGIKFLGESSRFAIKTYPNPTQDELNIELQLEKQSLLNVNILDDKGKTVLKSINNEQLVGKIHRKIDVSLLPKGNYILQINLNQESHNEQFIKL